VAKVAHLFPGKATVTFAACHTPGVGVGKNIMHTCIEKQQGSSFRLQLAFLNSHSPPQVTSVNSSPYSLYGGRNGAATASR